MSTRVEQGLPRPPKAIEKGDGQPFARVTILYPPDVIDRVQALARQQGIAFSALLRQWTMQRLDEEERRVRERERDQ